MKIAVFGCTGLVGGPVVDELSDRGFPVRLVSRDADRALRRFGPGSDVVEADAETGLGIDDALDGCDGVVLSIDSPQEGQCVGNVLDAAARSGGVDRLVYVSGCTALEENAWFPMVAGKVEAEAKLRESGLGWTVLAPSWFHETLTRFVRNGKAFLIGKDPNLYHFLAARDFARIVALAIQEPEAVNRRFVIHGPEGLTLREALTRYCQVRHPEIRRITNPPTWFLRGMARLTRNEILKSALDLMAYFETVGEMGDPKEAERLFGPLTTTLQEWLEVAPST